MKLKKQHGSSASGGFALVIALSLMAFVLLLLLSITAIVQVEQASAGISTGKLEAKQAALLSLNMALGKLQETAGLDQRVTAPAEAVATANGSKQLTGVWRSWEGKDHESNGLPKAPDYTSKLDTGELDIDSINNGRFLSWLVSSAYDPSNDAYEAEADSPPVLTEATETVPLVSVGSVGTNNTADEVHLQPTDVNGGQSAIAWWISGENTKALLRTKEDPDDTLGWKDRLTTSTQADSSVFGITDPNEIEGLDRVTGRNDYNLVSDSVIGGNSMSERYFHDVTGYARGLLTNTANGGWRRDLSLMSEQWNTLQSPDGGSGKFPFFTLSPGVETEGLKNSGALGGLMYPWAMESQFTVGGGSKPGGASVGWGALVDFATQYQEIVSGDANGNVTFNQKSGNGRDEINRLPVLARNHWVMSFESIDNGTVNGDGDSLYNAYLNLNTVITYWNPFNVSLNGAAGFWIFLETSLPYDMQFSVGDESVPTNVQDDYYRLEDYIVSNGKNIFNLAMPADSEVWQPGESRVYSITGRDGNSPNRFAMSRGYEEAIGFNRAIKVNGRSGTILAGGADDEFKVTLQDASAGAFKFDLYEWRTSLRADALNLQYNVSYADAELYWPEPLITNTTQTMGDLSLGDPSPFMVMMFQLPNITEYSVGSRGYTQRKPILRHVSQQVSDGLDPFPYDVVVDYPNGIAGGTSDSGLPVDGISETDPYSFIGTSYRFDDGLNSLITNEIPTKPLRSLGELQHFDVGFYSPVAPFVANPIGNSNASHLIKPDQVYVDDGVSAVSSGAYDHSYVANHLLFDDWFVSSIAPETTGYSSAAIRDTETVYSEFLSGDVKLPNSVYLPAEQLSKSAADSAASALLSDDSAWHSVASKLEVDGMFNINSTSVSAWTAMLKHMRGGEMPYVSNNLGATTYNVGLDSGADHPVGRTSVAGDPNAQLTPEYSAIGTHTRLTDAQIEALAAEIVEQVKTRGPFLSLSEFVNRRLTSDVDLSLAGAVESALEALSSGTDDAGNPYPDYLGDTFKANVVDVPAGVLHAFPEAAEGNLAYGFPGWIRQADVLRPLTPVLSARDDTFVIRAYGASNDTFSDAPQAEAWCEAIVQRRADYVDSNADDASLLPSDGTLSSEANKRFGRRFSIVSFRWLSPDEV